jgi:polysaccharide deacetylase family protein (PEP-CTERM system associated)
MATHALTVDVEDWYHVENLRGPVPPERWSGMPARLEANMERLLALFAEKGAKATFFVLGAAAKRHPAVVRGIVEAGHELACHGMSHDLVYRQTPEVFRSETRAAKALLEDQGGCAVRGYRASTFSITDRSWSSTTRRPARSCGAWAGQGRLRGRWSVPTVSS